MRQELHRGVPLRADRRVTRRSNKVFQKNRFARQLELHLLQKHPRGDDGLEFALLHARGERFLRTRCNSDSPAPCRSSIAA